MGDVLEAPLSGLRLCGAGCRRHVIIRRSSTMNTQSDHVTFTSSALPIEPGEDKETNPGIYGKALAIWVAQKMRDRGFTIAEVLPEDFGRIVIVRRKPFMLWIGCANID